MSVSVPTPQAGDVLQRVDSSGVASRMRPVMEHARWIVRASSSLCKVFVGHSTRPFPAPTALPPSCGRGSGGSYTSSTPASLMVGNCRRWSRCRRAKVDPSQAGGLLPTSSHLRRVARIRMEPSSRGEFHRPALREPDVTVSRHPARAIQPTVSFRNASARKGSEIPRVWFENHVEAVLTLQGVAESADLRAPAGLGNADDRG